MINGFAAKIFVYPPQGGDPSRAGEAREWRIDGKVLFAMRPPVEGWANPEAVPRAASVVLTGWTFDEFFLPCLDSSFLVTLDAGAGLAHRATGSLSPESIQVLRAGYVKPLRFEACKIQPAL